MLFVNYLLDLGKVKEKSMTETNVENFLLPLNGQIGQSSRLYLAYQIQKTCNQFLFPRSYTDEQRYLNSMLVEVNVLTFWAGASLAAR